MNMRFRTFLYVNFAAIIFFIAGGVEARRQYLLWDLGHVLVKPNKLKMAWQHTGISPFFKLWAYDLASGYTPQNPKKVAFELMFQHGRQECAESLKCRDNTGQELPQIMVDWLIGAKNPTEIVNQLDSLSGQLAAQGYFRHRVERLVCQKIINAMFSPQALVNCMQVIDQGLEIIHNLSQNEDYTLCIASNWDPVSFKWLYATKKGQKLFSYLDRAHLFISGLMGIAKPHPEFWQYVLQSLDVSAADCVLIDDQYENIESASACGMQTYHFDGDYQKLKEYFIV